MPRLNKSLLLMFLLAGCGGGTETPPTAGTSPVVPAVHEVQPTLAAPLATGVVQTAATTPATSSKTQLNYDQALELADQLIQKRDMNNALRILTGAIQVQPNSAEAYVKRAAILADSRLLIPAINDISVAIKLQPENPKYLNTRGYFHLLKEEFDLAEKDFTDAIAKDAKYPQPYNNRGLVSIGRQQFDKAATDFEAALAIDPQYVDARNNLGFSLLQRNQTEEAIAQFTQVLETKPDYLNAINNRGRAYQKVERFEESVADFTRAMELQPQNLQLQLHRAEVYKAWGKNAEAQADLEQVAWTQQRDEFNRLLSADNRNADLWVGFGRHLAKRNQIEDAMKCFDQALKLVPGHAHAHVGRGMVYMTQENFDQAIKDFTQALLDEPLLEAYSLRGDCHLKTGHLDGAIADYEMAKRIDSQVVDAYRQRSSKHSAAGESEQAKMDEDRAVALQQAIAERESAARDSSAPRAPLTEEQASALNEPVPAPPEEAVPQE